MYVCSSYSGQKHVLSLHTIRDAAQSALSFGVRSSKKLKKLKKAKKAQKAQKAQKNYLILIEDRSMCFHYIQNIRDAATRVLCDLVLKLKKAQKRIKRLKKHHSCIFRGLNGGMPLTPHCYSAKNWMGNCPLCLHAIQVPDK